MSIHINSKNVLDFTFWENKETVKEGINREYNFLFKYLEDYLKNNFSFILEKLNTKKDYQVIDLDESIILCKQGSKKSETILQIGYPFPIIEKKIEDLFCSGEIRICLHKTFLRKHQHKMLKGEFGYEEIVLEEDTFKKRSMELLKNCKNLCYLDTFNFVGDSITNLQILEIMKNYSSSVSSIYSRYPDCLGCFNQGELYLFDLKNISKIKKGSVIIIPNFIDIHQITLVQILQTLREKDLTFFVLGRNYIIDDHNKILFCISGQFEDILLKENVNDLITKSVYRFVNLVKTTQDPINLDLNKIPLKICLCPFASTQDKSFSKQDIENILKSKSDYFERYISISEKEKQSDLQLIKKLSRNNKVKLLTDHGFRDLKESVHKTDLDLFICMDSASSIFFTKLKKVVFTMYKAMNWDSENLRSLSGESPLGFCSYDLNQIPVIYSENISLGDLENFGHLINYCINKMSKSEKEYLKDIFLFLEQRRLSVKDKCDAASCLEYYRSIYGLVKKNIKVDISLLESFFPSNLFEDALVNNFSFEKKDLFDSLIRIAPLYKFLLNVVKTL